MTNELDVKQNGAVTTHGTIKDMPEFQPMENQDTIRLPRLVMVQEKRQEIKDGIAKPGDLINSLSKENYGSSIEIIPLVQLTSSRIRWGARSAGGGMLCVSRDGETGQGTPGGTCAKCPFFSIRKGQGPMDDKWCSQSYQIIALIRSTREPIMLTADSIRPSDTGIRDMLGMARMAANKGIRMFGKSYIIKTGIAKNAMGEFFKLHCLPGNNNAPLPQEEVDSLAGQMQFFRGANVDGEEKAVHSEEEF